MYNQSNRTSPATVVPGDSNEVIKQQVRQCLNYNMIEELAPDDIRDIANTIKQQHPAKKIRSYNCRPVSNGIPLIARNFYWLPVFGILIQNGLFDQDLVPNNLMISNRFAVKKGDLGHNAPANEEQFYLTESGIKFLNLIINKVDSYNPGLRPAFYEFPVSYLKKPGERHNYRRSDIERWIAEVEITYPIMQDLFPEMFTIKEAICNLAMNSSYDKVSDILVNKGMFDSKEKPAELLLQNQFAANVLELGVPDDMQESLKASYYITARGIEFLKKIVRCELSKELARKV